MLATPYDLILTFGYDSINDGIIKNASDLKTVLEQVGLLAGHGKTLDVVAHSMGGLISRYFIEQLGGNNVINNLVMLGTPNAGSPWATVQTWATTAVAVGINLLGTVAWPIKAVASLVGLIEKIDTNLDDMQVGSEVLNKLKGSSDPGVPYVLICGDVLLDVQKRPLLERLVKSWARKQFF